jgi:hypothetical protein
VDEAGEGVGVAADGCAVGVADRVGVGVDAAAGAAGTTIRATARAQAGSRARSDPPLERGGRVTAWLVGSAIRSPETPHPDAGSLR